MILLTRALGLDHLALVAQSSAGPAPVARQQMPSYYEENGRDLHCLIASFVLEDGDIALWTEHLATLEDGRFGVRFGFRFTIARMRSQLAVCARHLLALRTHRFSSYLRA